MIMLGVRNLDVSVRFYRDELGLGLLQRSPEFAFFKAGPIQLVLSVPLARERQTVAGATEVIFSVPSVNAAYTGLLERQIEFLRAPHEVYPGHWAANLLDPDGHLLTLFGPHTTP